MTNSLSGIKFHLLYEHFPLIVMLDLSEFSYSFSFYTFPLLTHKIRIRGMLLISTSKAKS